MAKRRPKVNKKLNTFVLFGLVMSLIITACASPTPSADISPEPRPEAMEGCSGRQYDNYYSVLLRVEYPHGGDDLFYTLVGVVGNNPTAPVVKTTWNDVVEPGYYHNTLVTEASSGMIVTRCVANPTPYTVNVAYGDIIEITRGHRTAHFVVLGESPSEWFRVDESAKMFGAEEGWWLKPDPSPEATLVCGSRTVNFVVQGGGLYDGLSHPSLRNGDDLLYGGSIEWIPGGFRAICGMDGKVIEVNTSIPATLTLYVVDENPTRWIWVQLFNVYADGIVG